MTDSILDQRVHTSRLLGKDSTLVMHGGGNTSVKDAVTNILGEKEEVIYIKGSGWDLATIEAQGFPAVKMSHLMKLRQLPALSDPEMVNELRTHLVNASSPDPSVETLLHAFIPHKFVDHTHSDAVLTLTNQPNGEELIRSLYKDRIGVVPYVMPGFQLAKLCIEVFEANPKVEGLILLRHGIFTFGETAKESYDRMIALVKVAEDHIGSKVKTIPVNESKESPAEWTQAIRKALLKKGFPCVLKFEKANILDVNAFLRGPLTPDHVIRTKRLPVVLSSIESIEKSVDQYQREYDEYFIRCCEKRNVRPQKLDPWPRVFIIPGLGFVTAGATEKDTKISADIYRHTISVVQNAEQIGRYDALPEEDIFDVEYWVLEQAKLKLGSKKQPLTSKTAVVTGGASGIGLAICKELTDQGAKVFSVDLNKNPLASVHSIEASVADSEKMRSAMDQVVASCGGIDILVINAGVLTNTNLVENIQLEDWKKSFAVNVDGAFFTLQSALPWMKNQGSGGDVILIATKNVPAPGKENASYSVSKTAQAQLARICALENGAAGIRVNMLHPHLIFDTGIWSDEILAKRAAAYSMTVEQYKKNNLLKTDLSSKDVAKSVFALVAGYFSKTTGAQIPIDGGSDRTL